MNQEMYGATGKVGNKVYYRANGKTVSRELVTPKNPKTDLQTIQRVIAAQVGKSYQKFKDICDHSFEGVTNGAQCMNRFRKLNMRYCRERAAEIQQSGSSLSQFYNFQPIGTDKWVPNATILALVLNRCCNGRVQENTIHLRGGADSVEHWACGISGHRHSRCSLWASLLCGTSLPAGRKYRRIKLLCR